MQRRAATIDRIFIQNFAVWEKLEYLLALFPRLNLAKAMTPICMAERFLMGD